MTKCKLIPLYPSKVIAQCEDELAIIEAALAVLDEAAAA